MKFISYSCVFTREILGFSKISRDVSWAKIKPGSRELNPILYMSKVNVVARGIRYFCRIPERLL